jgi:hypothetical protein
MNNRMQELVEQAIHNEPFDCGALTKEQWLEKFAELIVRECANHCDLLLNHKMSSEWARGTHDCSKAIKKHFGVE